MADSIIASVNPTIYVDNAKCVAAEISNGRLSRRDWGDIYCLPDLKKYFGSRKTVVDYFFNEASGREPLNPESEYYIDNESPIQDWTYVADYTNHLYYNGNNEVKRFYIHARIDCKNKFEFAFFDRIIESKNSNNRYIFNSFSDRNIDVPNKEEDNINHILRIGTKEESEKIILTTDKSKIKVSACPQYAGHIMNKNSDFTEIEGTPVEFTSYGHVWTYWYTIIDDVLYFCGFPLYIGNDKGSIKYKKNDEIKTLSLNIPPTDYDLENTNSDFYKAIRILFGDKNDDSVPCGAKAILSSENFGDYTESTPITSRIMTKIERKSFEHIQHGDISFSSSSFGYTKGGVYPIRGVPTVKNYDEVTFLSMDDEIYRNKCIEETGVGPQEPAVANDGTPNTLYNMEYAWCETGFLANKSKNRISSEVIGSNGVKTYTVDIFNSHNVSYIQTAIKNNSLTINIPLPMIVNYELLKTYSYSENDEIIITPPNNKIEPSHGNDSGTGGLDVEYEELDDTGVPPPPPPPPPVPYNPGNNNNNNNTTGNGTTVTPLKFLTLDFGRIRKDGKDGVVFVNYDEVYGVENPTTFPVELIGPELDVSYVGINYHDGYNNLQRDFWYNIPITQHVEPVILMTEKIVPIFLHVDGVLDLSGIEFFDTGVTDTYYLMKPREDGEGENFGIEEEISPSRYELLTMHYNYMIDKNSSSFILTYKSSQVGGNPPTSENKEINAMARIEVFPSINNGGLITCDGVDNNIIQNNGYFTNKIFVERAISSGTYSGFIHSFTIKLGKNSRAFFKAKKHCVMANNDAVYSAIALGAQKLIEEEDLGELATYSGGESAEAVAQGSKLRNRSIYASGSASFKIAENANLYYGANSHDYEFSGNPKASISVKLKVTGDPVPLHLKSSGDSWLEAKYGSFPNYRYSYELNKTVTFKPSSYIEVEKTISSI